MTDNLILTVPKASIKSLLKLPNCEIYFSFKKIDNNPLTASQKALSQKQQFKNINIIKAHGNKLVGACLKMFPRYLRRVNKIICELG